MKRALTLLGLALLVTGCAVGPDDPQGDQEIGAEDVGEATQALCTDVTVSGSGASNYYVGSLPAGVYPAMVDGASPTSTYGSTACSTRFVVDASAVAGSNLTVYARYNDTMPTTQSACNATGVVATAYGYVPSCNPITHVCTGKWEAILGYDGNAEQTAYGAWKANPLLPSGGVCQATNGGWSPWLSWDVSSTKKYSTVRVAAAAFGWIFPKKVEAMVARAP